MLSQFIDKSMQYLDSASFECVSHLFVLIFENNDIIKTMMSTSTN